MQSSPTDPAESIQQEAPLQLLLFVDRRPSSREQIRTIRNRLKNLEAETPFALEVIDVGEQPYLAEHFKLVATPALLKICPEPRQTLAGSDLVKQLEHWWPRWQRAAEEYLAAQTAGGKKLHPEGNPSSVARSTELIYLSDEIFRLNQANEKLQEQLQFKDLIISMLAHDLRNPLTAASIALETLEMAYQQNADTQRASRLTPELMAQLLRHARTQTRSIDRMITDILQAARGSSTELCIYPQGIDVRELCLEVLDALQEQLQGKNLEVWVDIPADLPRVYADRERMRQVLMNLMDNAMKYTPPGGKIGISGLHRTTQKVQITICDDGPGIPEENREKIFEDRFRLKRDEGQAGYGIGLALCQRIIRAHYGQIWVDSAPQQGSCFHFTLPVYRA
ncbi:histidine kinase [Geitlerinema sp. PCC 7407]|uniref:histidine kinase n=1 Tax=Geitlerinema sp. PCC 7407 TaxID=1173025 RepID=UPI00029FF8C2|nr:histidine kinase [Geitlerinema sp. PCC 7407]AFY68031.1 histidine kinase [Geitlerinema sp. PCC 7407]